MWKISSTVYIVISKYTVTKESTSPYSSSFHLCLHSCFFNFFIFLDLDIGLDSRVHKNGLNFTLRVSRRSDTWICRWREFPSFLCVSPGLNGFSSCASLTGGLLMEICSSASDIWSVILLRSRLFSLLTALAPLSGHAFDIGRGRMISAIHTSLE